MLRDEPISEKVDLYGFGIMLWEMYTGKLPWSDKNYHQMIHTVAVSFFSLVVFSCLSPAHIYMGAMHAPLILLRIRGTPPPSSFTACQCAPEAACVLPRTCRPRISRVGIRGVTGDMRGVTGVSRVLPSEASLDDMRVVVS